MRQTLVVLSMLFAFGPAATEPDHRTLTFEERVAAQKAIEAVYWRHRIWPRENPRTKPPLSGVMSDDSIRAKVEDYLKKSNALETWWQQPISGGQLQAEMNRMAKGSRDPQVLQELFAALRNDPHVIAETLARQTLVDRLIRNWYAGDTRIHTGARSVPWPKQPFETWWAAQRASEGLGIAEPSSKFVLPIIPSSECTVDTWSPTRQDLPDARDRHTAVWTGAEMIVWGGQNSNVLNSGARYDPSTDTWTATALGTSVPTARYEHTAVWTGTEMIVWGGASLTGLTNSGGRYDPTTDTWSATSQGVDTPAGRYLHTVVWTGTEMIVWGGTLLDDLNSGGRYRPDTNTWVSTSTGANAPDVRSLHSAVWTGTEMIVWGGVNGDPNGPTGEHYLNTGARYNPSSDSWSPTPVGGFNPSGRYLHTAVWTGTEMIVWGGAVHGENNQVSFPSVGGRYSPSTNSWTATSTGLNAPSGRIDQTAVWTGTEMIIWGGVNNFILNNGGLYNPATNTWRATSIGANVPRQRYSQSGVWTGTEMIVWGGSVGFNAYAQTGGRFNPTSNTWVPTSIGGNEPSARVAHTGIWTGSEMIVWGGETYDGTSVYLNTGGRFDAATDSWSATSIGANVPPARSSHTAVWTGLEMVVWGGYASNTSVSTGGRYDPASNTWAATSMSVDVPVARYLHSAVWTGSEMIVWGGLAVSGVTKTGGRYDPSNDHWIPTSSDASAPDARDSHTAVWTGQEMIVWGGKSSIYDYFNSGGRYDPSSDHWLPTATPTNEPGARAQHTAVWTGTEMIVWGGALFHISNGWSFFNSGGRYSPTADSWTATSVELNAPSGRRWHSSVWSGREMLVWGGVDFSSYYQDGGRYNPSGNTWIPTATTGAPDPREEHSAVWTGAEMVVWGGWPLTASGGRYCARDACVGSDGPVSCDDQNACTDDSCDSASGCTHVNNVNLCDDGEVCTLNDACAGGACQGTPVGLPAETENLRAQPDKQTYTWDPEPEALSYDVVRGLLNALPVGPGGGDETCFNALAAAVFTDAANPSAGTGFWYLSRGQSACGSGTLGNRGFHGSPGAPRLTSTCP